MPQRETHKQRSNDVYAEHMNRDYSHNGKHSLYHGQSPYYETKDVEKRSSNDDRRAKTNTHEMRSVSQKRTSYEDTGTASSMFTGSSVYHSERESYEQQQQHRQALYNFRYILTTRGLCQITEVFLNLIMVICAGVPYSNNGGYRDLASLGGIYHYYFGGAGAFTGTDAERVKQLDQQFHQIQKPPYVMLMACGGAFMTYACAMLALGVFRVPYRWPPMLVVEAVMNFLIGLGYILLLAFYFLELRGVYSTAVCIEREHMYKSKGHKGFECQLNGADIAGGLFGVFGVCVFIFGSVVAVRAFRSVRKLKKERANEEANV
uniref:MARVEL domain containing 3 n=1 Tax=Oryzias latipes TaxID=8090 RepID=A0A3P9M1K4_ORYLA